LTGKNIERYEKNIGNFLCCALQLKSKRTADFTNVKLIALTGRKIVKGEKI